MNRRKHYLYNPQEYTKTIDLWLKKYKGKKIIWLEKYKRILGIRTLPKHRHRRSIAIRNLKLLSWWAEKSWEELNCWREHGVTCEQVKKHRIYVYHY